ncbi:MAG: pimeloyl-ACP methyl ester carboxylesterase [Candidatus Azotimanducaceae bacterium]|jgi:pimeloyl-ACP methyl ester carboxylesterase
MRLSYRIAGVIDKEICFDLNVPSNPAGICVFLHGFKGFKDWGLFNEVSNFFASNNFAFLKLNFSHNGCSPDHLSDFVDLEAFGNNCYSYELKDLMLVLDWIKLDSKLNDLPIHVIGHSRGAGIALLGGAQDNRVVSVTSWASVYDFKNRFVADLEAWKEAGVIYTRNGRTNQDMPLFYSFYTDYQNHKSELDIPYWIKKIDKPLLLVHGTNDNAVLIDDVYKLKEAQPKAQLLVLQNADHTFGVKHPPLSKEFTEDLQNVVAETLAFILSVNA